MVPTVSSAEILGSGPVELLERATRKKIGTSLRWRQMAGSLLWATLAGGMLSVTVAAVTIVLAGAGHGAHSPGFVFFGPVFAVRQFVLYDSGLAARYQLLSLLIAAVSYAAYGFVISMGRLWRRGTWALLLVLLVHYAGVLVCMTFESWDGARNLNKVAGLGGGLIVAAAIELFVVLHVLAAQYAMSCIPYRVRLTTPVVLMLVAGLFLALAVQAVLLTDNPYY